MYNIVEEDPDRFYEYFKPIGYELEKGDEFFYFSRRESRADLERKIEQAYKWIDVLDFFKTYNSSFGVGFRFTASHIQVQVKMDANLKDKLEQLKKPLAEGNIKDRVQRLIDELLKYGFIELESEILQEYKVLSAYQYIEQLIVNIHITEEPEDEVLK